jgi:hypothetical protein
MSYWGTAYSQVKQAFKCRRCGEIGLRYAHEKCDCQSINRGNPYIKSEQ